MTAPALFFALALLATEDQAGADAPVTTNAPPAAETPAPDGTPAVDAAPTPAPKRETEPLPPGAPTDQYQLTAWCYGALDEYLDIYQRVKPEIAAIDAAYGPKTPKEAEPYAQDMAALRVERKILSEAVAAAEKASPRPLALQGAQAVAQGRSIWRPAETKTPRELARAWMTWGLPDRCASSSRDLASKSALLGQALNSTDAAAPPTAGPATVPDVTPPTPAPTPPATDAPVATPDAAAPSAPPPSAP